MKVTELFAELSAIVDNGTIATTLYMMGGEWSGVQVAATSYATHKTISVHIDNTDTSKIKEQLKQLRDMVNNK